MRIPKTMFEAIQDALIIAKHAEYDEQETVHIILRCVRDFESRCLFESMLRTNKETHARIKELYLQIYP